MTAQPKDTEVFWDALFRYVDWEDDDMIEIRRIGQDGRSQSIPVQPALTNPAQIIEHRASAAPPGVGTFICPAVLNDRKATDRSVKAFPCLVVDFDSGETNVKVDSMRKALGDPTLVVHSGGWTDRGTEKVHVYYRLDEIEYETGKVALVREAMALKFGGDPSFKRVPQVIRIPGSVYDKDASGQTMCRIMEVNPDSEVSLEYVSDALAYEIEVLSKVDGALDFSMRHIEESKDRAKQLASETISQGGEHDTRFGRFTEYAGRWIGHARSGDCTEDEAYQYVCNWVMENMDPPWEADRVRREFNALLILDKKNHAAEWDQPELIEVPDGKEDWSWLDFDARSMFKGKPEPIPFLVDQLLVEGSTHGLVADGGIGKTYVALETAMRCAIGPKRGNRVFGFPVLQECVSILITVEDSKDDLHRRIYNVDKTGRLLKQTEGRLLVLPVADEVYGGLTLVERDQKGNHTVSSAWKTLTDKMQEIRDAFPDHPFVIFLDTYSATHHGDENSSAGTNEWFRAASIVRNKFNAAVYVTHHIRKAGTEPINTPAEMRQHIRGSNAFQNNCRVVFGLWEMPGSRSLAGEMDGDDDEKSAVQFLNFAPLKANIGIDWSHRCGKDYPDPILTLRRTGSGLPIFDERMHNKRISYKERKAETAKTEAAKVGAMTEAALYTAIRDYAKKGRPLNQTEITKDKAVVLPFPVCELGRSKIEEALTRMVVGELVTRKSIKAGRSKMVVYDVPDGPFATGTEQVRSEDPFVIKWSGYEYDEHLERYCPV